jgi:cytochrome c oxidase subunit I+III
VVAAGVAIVMVDLARNFRPSLERGNAGNLWGAGTLEWLPSGAYQTRSIPIVESREPLWSQPNLAEEVRAGAYYMPGTLTGARETMVTSTSGARPQYVLTLPGPGWSPLIGAVFTAAFFLLLVGKFTIAATLCGVVAVAAILVWSWGNDPGPGRPEDVGGGLTLPVNVTGRKSHAWMATVILNIVLFNIFASVIFAYLFLWSAPAVWRSSAEALPALWAPALAILLLLAGSLLAAASKRLISRSRAVTALLQLLTGPLLVAGAIVPLLAHWEAGLRPDVHSYGAVVFTLLSLLAVLTAAVLVICLYCVVRIAGGRLDHNRRLTLEVSAMMTHYAVFQGVATVLFIHAMPHLLGAGP